MLRATLRTLLARKARLALTVLAVAVGVAFLAGALVFGAANTAVARGLAEDEYHAVDVRIAPDPRHNALVSHPFIDSEILERAGRTPGVARVRPRIIGHDVARVLDQRGRPLVNRGGQDYANWVDGDPVRRLSLGRPPRTDTEVVADRELTDATHRRIGDTVTVRTADGVRHRYTLVGIVEAGGGRASVAGEYALMFTDTVAGSLVFGQAGRYTAATVDAAPGVAAERLASVLRTRLGDGVEVQTGAQLSKRADSSGRAVPSADLIGNVLLGFGCLTLLVGAILILNTFSITVAQRTGELALARALGASRGQLRRSVLVEAAVTGTVGSVAGLGLGTCLGWGGARWLSATAHLTAAPLTVSPGIVAGSLLAGVAVTVVAAMLPARRASRVAVMAALTDAATPQRPTRRLTLAGAITSGAGVAAVAGGCAAGMSSGPLLLVLGMPLCIVGVVLLAPALVGPVGRALGRTLDWSVPGRLGQRNVTRQPRRSAAAAVTIIIGVTLVALTSTVFASLGGFVRTAASNGIHAELIVVADRGVGIDAESVRQIRAMPSVDTVGLYVPGRVGLNGKTEYAATFDDWSAARTTLRFTATAGTVESLRPGQVIVDESTASRRKLHVHDAVSITLPKTGEHRYQVTGIVRDTVLGGLFLPSSDAREGFESVTARAALVKLRDGADVSAVHDGIDRLYGDDPDLAVETREQFIGEATAILDYVPLVVQALLAATLAVGTLGIVNTLLLSMLERTRELGSLRALGLGRRQVMGMVAAESVIIMVFGAVLGLVLGCSLGSAVVRSYSERDLGYSDPRRLPVELPWGLLAAYLAGAVLIGLLASIIPARRAARASVLDAIAHD